MSIGHVYDPVTGACTWEGCTAKVLDVVDLSVCRGYGQQRHNNWDRFQIQTALLLPPGPHRDVYCKQLRPDGVGLAEWVAAYEATRPRPGFDWSTGDPRAILNRDATLAVRSRYISYDAPNTFEVQTDIVSLVVQTYTAHPLGGRAPYDVREILVYGFTRVNEFRPTDPWPEPTVWIELPTRPPGACP